MVKVNIKMNKDYFVKIEGRNKNGLGKKVVILGGVHGNEYFGVEAIQEILQEINLGKIVIESGEVSFGFGNLRAMEGRVRYVEQNLNRMFKNRTEYTAEVRKSYEYKRAQIIKKYLSGTDVLLDVHGSYTKDSEPFLICEKNSKNVSDKLGVGKIVYGFDQVEPGGTDYYMNKIGKVGICVECGYLGENRKSKEYAKKVILNFLISNKIIAGTEKLRGTNIYLQMYKKYFSKTNDFKLEKYFKDFEIVRAGQIIGRDGQEIITVGEDSFVLFASNQDRIGSECFLLGENITLKL